ncbi:helix-turn-helix transcriptional regulator [Agromyces archimandritae]|uniref:HTH luxR-type domain-containing protein n=1 Tax=Agromyces archimandritae TaxID=2781962 RepID=A0A975IMH7_9MICO|nr:helix-turn-helix transcriptional regulator [Agromyces archimandritae]QTX03503.1 hypothetical protein G127AT_09030 [Agromyces archimandritae]
MQSERQRADAHLVRMRALEGAAAAVIESSLYDGHPVGYPQYDLLRAVSPGSILDVPVDVRLEILAARVVMFVRGDLMDEAVQAAEGLDAALVTAAGDAIACRTRMAALGAVAEAHIAAGDAVRAMRFAEAIISYTTVAPESDALQAARWRYRGLGLQAASYALNGRQMEADAILDEMAGLAEAQGWDPDRAEFMAAIAEGTIAFMRLDADRASRLSSRIRRLTVSEPTARMLADLLEAVALVLNGDPYRASKLAVLVAQGVSQPTGSSLIRSYGRMLVSYIFLYEGQPVRALAQLADMEPSERHCVDPNAPRAAAYLSMADYRQVLTVTAECVRMRSRHNLWLFPLILMCRSIAHLRLGHQVIALREVGEAMAYAQRANLSAVFSMIPDDEIEHMRQFVEHRAPRFAGDLQRYRVAVAEAEQRMGARGTVSEKLPKMSERESVVASMLGGPMTFAAMAAELHVSTGTVKRQAAAVYHKLGVKTREEAVLRLEELGYL